MCSTGSQLAVASQLVVFRLSMLCALIATYGCTAHIIEDDRVAESVSVWNVGCNKPYDLVRDCSGAWGPTLKVVIGDQAFDLAATEDGSVI